MPTIANMEKKVNISKIPSKLSQKLPQYLATVTVALVSFCAGTGIGWTSPVLARLQGKEGTYEPLDHPLTDVEVSWISSLLTVGGLFGPLCAGICLDRFGRKNSILVIGGPPAILGWILILCATDFATICAARFIIGLSFSCAGLLGFVYVAETVSASERGTLCSMHQFMFTLGNLLDYAVGPYVSYHTLAVINLVIPIIFVLSFFFMPETPYHLLAIGKRDEAEKSLKWLRGGWRSNGYDTPVDVTEELNAIAKAVEESSNRSFTMLDSMKDLFSSRGNRRALLASIGLMLNQQLSGILAVLFNAESIFRGGSDEKPLLNASESTIVIGVVQMVASSLVTVLADRAGRRPLLILSSAFSSLSLASLGVYSYLEMYHSTSAAGLSWIPIVSLVAYIIFYCQGLGPYPWIMLGELFPSSAKSAAAIVSGSANWFVGFFVTLTFQMLSNAIGSFGVYWFYSGCCALGVIFTILFIPETKCKTLEEIQHGLNRKSRAGE